MIIIYFLYGFLSTCFFLNLFLPFLKNNLLDIPKKRSSHKKPTPTGGGIVFPLQSIIISILSGNFSSLICLPLAITGFFDDKINLSSKIRFFFQIITCIFIVYLFPINISTHQTPGIMKFILFPLLIFIFTAFINFINFMDGIDGLLCTCMLVGFIFIGLKNDPLIFILVGTLLGFLRMNWDPAKVFMGDVGSTFLAAYFLIAIIKIDDLENSIGSFLIISPLIIDSIICVLRRFCYGENIFKPHKLHLYQRLCQSGLSHSKVTIIYSIACFLLGILFYFFNIYYLIFGIFIFSMVGIWLDQNLAVNFRNSIES